MDYQQPNSTSFMDLQISQEGPIKNFYDRICQLNKSNSLDLWSRLNPVKQPISILNSGKPQQSNMSVLINFDVN